MISPICPLSQSTDVREKRNGGLRRFVDWIWHVRGGVALSPGQSSDEAFGRLAPLFRQTGTSHERTSDTLIFRKKDPAAQDKMSIFDSGILYVERGPSGPMLRYMLVSRTLLFCFLVPLLFLGFAGMTIIVAKYEKPSLEAAKKEADEKKKKEKDKVLPQSAIDKFLGAPAPEKPKKDSKDDARGVKPTSAYVLAGIFAVLYIFGRILEAHLIKLLFRNKLRGL